MPPSSLILTYVVVHDNSNPRCPYALPKRAFVRRDCEVRKQLHVESLGVLVVQQLLVVGLGLVVWVQELVRVLVQELDLVREQVLLQLV